ncbi:MAG TPA: SDR family oxidoreductase [Thermoanaerobaculia bacterium]|nr:SDR family oxidoreductase [Thermoanaerobaculia bacterium]
MTRGDLVVITGAGRGIGREAALQFARHRWRVLVTYHRDPGAAETVAGECRRAGAPDAWAWELDVREPASIRGFSDRLFERFGEVTALVNNAGVIVWNPLSEQTEEEIRSQLETNLVGAILLTRALLPYVRETVIQVGSDLGYAGMAELAPYCATKFGLRGFCQALAQERPDLRFLCVNPDRTATSMNRFQGRDPRVAGEVIWRAAAGHYGVASGGDVNVWEVVAQEAAG